LLGGLPLGALYQHEYREIDAAFPYQDMTLSALGIPPQDVLSVSTDTADCYLEMV
jgi:hypothetical protein